MQDDVQEQYADIYSDTTLQDLSSEENDENLVWCHHPISDRVAVLQFMGEQNGVDKTTAHKVTGNIQPLTVFSDILAVIVYETN